MSKLAYQYVVLRCVPRVDREEFVNVGVVLYCHATDFLRAAWHVDRDRLRALDPRLDLDQVCEALEFIEGVCAGDQRGRGGGAAVESAVRVREGAPQHRDPARAGARRGHHRSRAPAGAPAGAAGQLTAAASAGRAGRAATASRRSWGSRLRRLVSASQPLGSDRRTTLCQALAT